MPRDSHRELLLPDRANSHACPHIQLIISLNTTKKFWNFVADKDQANQLFETLLWMRNKYEEGVKMYNQLLREKTAVNEENKKLLQKIKDQKARVLRMKNALTYMKN